MVACLAQSHHYEPNESLLSLNKSSWMVALPYLFFFTHILQINSLQSLTLI